MIIASYLKQYNRTEDRVVGWLMQNGCDRVIATFILDAYANVNKKFSTGYALDQQLLKDCIESQSKNVSEFLEVHKKLSFKPSLIDRAKAWITKR